MTFDFMENRQVFGKEIRYLLFYQTQNDNNYSFISFFSHEHQKNNESITSLLPNSA